MNNVDYKNLDEELIDYITLTIDPYKISKKEKGSKQYEKFKRNILKYINSSIIYYWYSTTPEQRQIDQDEETKYMVDCFIDYDYPDTFKDYVKYGITYVYSIGDSSKIDEFIKYTDLIYEKLLKIKSKQMENLTLSMRDQKS